MTFFTHSCGSTARAKTSARTIMIAAKEDSEGSLFQTFAGELDESMQAFLSPLSRGERT